MGTTETTIRVDPRSLRTFCATSFQQMGVPAGDAAIVADTLVRADLRNTYSHGSALLPLYVRRIREGATSPVTNVEIRAEYPATALVDGKNGLGQVIAVRAIELAIGKAKQAGCAWIGVKGSNHFGMAAYYAMLALPHDMIGIVSTVSNINTMAPWGGLDVLIGNNPIAIAVPAGEEFPVVFDAAFSTAARRKIWLALEAGESIPEGWALDRDGNPTIDARAALDGLLLPIGGHKGYGFAFVMSLLAGALTGAHIGRSVSNSNVGHLMGAINIAAFCDPSALKCTVDCAVREVRSSRRAPGVQRVFVPGEQGFLAEQERLRHGIPLPRETVSALDRVASELGIQPLTK